MERICKANVFQYSVYHIKHSEQSINIHELMKIYHTRCFYVHISSAYKRHDNKFLWRCDHQMDMTQIYFNSGFMIGETGVGDFSRKQRHVFTWSNACNNNGSPYKTCILNGDNLL